MSEYEWEFKSLDELGSISRGKSKHRPRDASHLFGGPYPFIQTGDVKSAGLFLESYNETYSEEGLAQSKLWPKGTLCITIAANIAETSILGIDACFPDSVIGFIPHENVCDVRYVKYLLELKKMEIQAAFAGSVQLNMSMKELLKWKFPIPPYVIQRKIGDHVSNYDYMGRSNRNISDISQKLISNLFRSWFIDFDPVKSKAQGNLPCGMDEETAALFPDSFDDSEHGHLPKGWTWGTLLDISTIWTGGTPKTSESSYWGGDIPWVSGADLSSSELFSFDSARKITSLGVDKSSTKVLPVGTVMITARGTVGATKITAVPMAMSQTSFGFKAKKGISDALVYQASQETIRQLRSFAYGAVFDTFTQSTINITKIAIAPLEILQAFGKIVDPLFEMIKTSTKAEIDLINTRDSLLPRLMSGELSVS